MEGHIVIFPSPGMGHLIPLAELAQRLLHHGRLSVTFIIPSTLGAPIKPQNDILNTMSENISSIFLPPIDLNDIPDDATIETRIGLTMSRSFPSLRQTLAELIRDSKRPSALIVDVFGGPSFEIIKDFNIPAYIFCTVSAMTLISIFHIPNLDKMYACEFRDIPEPIRLPRCVPVHGSDMPEPLQDKKNVVYNHMIHLSKLFSLSQGILVNSFFELEYGAFNALEEGDWCKPDVYSVGPLIR
nr:hydroquinone glucosyltransferase-like [Tanacetum cinerariifolium]